MPPDIFRFSAALPAHAAFEEPLRQLIRQGIAYAGYPQEEVGPMAKVVESAAVDSLPASNGQTMGLRFSLTDGALVVEVEGSYLPSAPPPAGPMDEVTVTSRGGRTQYRFVRRLPAAAA